MNGAKQMIRRDLAETMIGDIGGGGISAPEFVDQWIEHNPESASQYALANYRRMLIADVERMLKEPADSGIKGGQAEMFKEVLEACPGLQRCMSFKNEKGDVRYVPWYRASDGVIDLAMKHDDEQIEALQRKKVSKQQLKRLRTEHGVPEMIGWIDYKREVTR